MMPLDRVAARFQLEAKAGSGAVGVVYRAHDVQTGHTVAVKLMRFDDEQSVQRFTREAEVLSVASTSLDRRVRRSWDDRARRAVPRDFGIARLAGAGTLTGTGATLGTPAYMAPEQATGARDADARSDSRLPKSSS